MRLVDPTETPAHVELPGCGMQTEPVDATWPRTRLIRLVSCSQLANICTVLGRLTRFSSDAVAIAAALLLTWLIAGHNNVLPCQPCQPVPPALLRLSVCLCV